MMAKQITLSFLGNKLITATAILSSLIFLCTIIVGGMRAADKISTLNQEIAELKSNQENCALKQEVADLKEQLRLYEQKQLEQIAINSQITTICQYLLK